MFFNKTLEELKLKIQDLTLSQSIDDQEVQRCIQVLEKNNAIFDFNKIATKSLTDIAWASEYREHIVVLLKTMGLIIWR